jgi:hypothetical protein
MFFYMYDEIRGSHFIFHVDEAALVQKTAAKPAADGKPAVAATWEMAPDTFIEVKRMAKVPLEGVKVEMGMPPDEKKFHPIRKVLFYDEKKDAVVAPKPVTPTTPTPNPATRNPVTPTPTTPTTPTPPTADNGWNAAPLEKPVLAESNQLPVGIGVGSANADVLAAGASGHLTNKQFDSLDVDASTPDAALAELPKAGNPVQQLAVPAGKRMVQVTMAVKPGGDPWAWAPAVGDFTVVDGAGTVYKPSGVFSVVGSAAGQKLLATYKSTGDVAVKKVDGTVPTSVTLVYLLPTGQKATELRYQAKPGGLPLEK